MSRCSNDDCAINRSVEVDALNTTCWFAGYGYYLVYHRECCPRFMEGERCENHEFKPCLTSPGNCPEATDASKVRFHQWKRALSFAFARNRGQKKKYWVRHDGKHWIVDAVDGKL